MHHDQTTAIHYDENKRCWKLQIFWMFYAFLEMITGLKSTGNFVHVQLHLFLELKKLCCNDFLIIMHHDQRVVMHYDGNKRCTVGICSCYVHL